MQLLQYNRKAYFLISLQNFFKIIADGFIVVMKMIQRNDFVGFKFQRTI